MKDFIVRHGRRQRQESKRKARLLRKIQKARALEHVGEIFVLPSWRKRFGMTARLRAEVRSNG